MVKALGHTPAPIDIEIPIPARNVGFGQSQEIVFSTLILYAHREMLSRLY